MVTPGQRRAERGYNRRAERGYNLVALVIGVTILNVLLAAVLPLWSTAIRREKEEELIFRGLQYAEAIRVFQNRFHHLPTRLEELLEVKPRCIRQLWKDPMTEDGKWALVIQGQPLLNQGDGSNPIDLSGVDPNVGNPSAVDPATGKGTTRTIGPIRGVYSLSSKESIATFMGQQQYNKWTFTVDLLQGGAGGGQQGGGNQIGQFPQDQGQGGALVQSLRWIGRPMRTFMAPPQGGLPLPNPGSTPKTPFGERGTQLPRSDKQPGADGQPPDLQ